MGLGRVNMLGVYGTWAAVLLATCILIKLDKIVPWVAEFLN